MPTVSGMRRRGGPPPASCARSFIHIGITKISVDDRRGGLEHTIRDEFNPLALRRLAFASIKVVIPITPRKTEELGPP